MVALAWLVHLASLVNRGRGERAVFADCLVIMERMESRVCRGSVFRDQLVIWESLDGKGLLASPGIRVCKGCRELAVSVVRLEELEIKV